jgi:hypothetical protein
MEDTLVEIVDSEHILGQEVLDIVLEGLSVLVLFTFFHGLDEWTHLHLQHWCKLHYLYRFKTPIKLRLEKQHHFILIIIIN